MTVPENANGFQKVWFEDAEGNQHEIPGATIMGIDIACDDSLDFTEIVVVSHSRPGSYEVIGRFYTSDSTQPTTPSKAPSLSQNKYTTGREPGTIKHVDKLDGLDSLK